MFIMSTKIPKKRTSKCEQQNITGSAKGTIKLFIFNVQARYAGAVQNLSPRINIGTMISTIMHVSLMILKSKLNGVGLLSKRAKWKNLMKCISIPIESVSLITELLKSTYILEKRQKNQKIICTYHDFLQEDAIKIVECK